MKAIVNYSGDYVGYMLINGVAYAVAQGITLDNLVERVTKSIQNVLAGHDDMMVGYVDPPHRMMQTVRSNYLSIVCGSSRRSN